MTDECLCNVGVQACPEHPDHLFTIDQRFAFERAWDARFKESKERARAKEDEAR